MWGLRGALELSKLSLRVQLLLPQPKLVTCWLPLASLAFVFNGSAVIAAAPLMLVKGVQHLKPSSDLVTGMD